MAKIKRGRATSKDPQENVPLEADLKTDPVVIGRDRYFDSISWGDPQFSRACVIETISRIDGASCQDEWNDAIGEMILILLYSTAGDFVVGPFDKETLSFSPEVEGMQVFIDFDFQIFAADLSWKIRNGFQGRVTGRPKDWNGDRVAAEVVKGVNSDRTTLADLTRLVSEVLKERPDTAQKRVLRVAAAQGVNLRRAKPFGHGEQPRLSIKRVVLFDKTCDPPVSPFQSEEAEKLSPLPRIRK